MMEWITDRQPTKEDEYEGEVVMQCFPGRRRSSNGMVNALVAAAHVGPGVPWRHTIYWKPSATPEPEPEAPQPAPKPELRVGQTWLSREGELVIIKNHFPNNFFSFQGANGRRYTPQGRFCNTGTDRRDLVELITCAFAESAQPDPAPTTRKVPRLFAAPLRRTLFPSGAIVVDAIADDGTCWVRIEGRDLSRKWLGEDVRTEWRQIPALPDREEPIDAA